MVKKFEDRDSEIVERIAHVVRCSKVVKGGRRFGFCVIAVVGDRRGRIGIGMGKAPEVGIAKSKAVQKARKSIILISMRELRTLHSDIYSKYCSGEVLMRAAPPGTGVIAGGALRSLFDVLGMRDIVVKAINSTNPHNLLKAAIKGLQSSTSPRYIAEKRGKKINDIVNIRNKVSKH